MIWIIGFVKRDCGQLWILCLLVGVPGIVQTESLAPDMVDGIGIVSCVYVFGR
jgi:hypothetical protein